MKRIIIAGMSIIALAAYVWWAGAIYWFGGEQGESRRGGRQAQPAPVEVAAVEHGTLVVRRTFSGSLEPTATVVVAPKVAGRIKVVKADLADEVTRGQLVVEMDSEEFDQAVAQAKAELAVAEASVAQLHNALEIAKRELSRVTKLYKDGIASESQYDAARADQLSKDGQLKVAEAQVRQAEVAVNTAEVRQRYTQIAVEWPEPESKLPPEQDKRLVAERHVDEGDTVSANTPLLTVVEITPITGVIYVTEKDYRNINPGQKVLLVTDAVEGEFEGTVTRVSPVFRSSSRQARVEFEAPNADRALKPGMFVRATLTLEVVEGATIVPMGAVTTRGGTEGVFVVNESGDAVKWLPVKTGAREGRRLQVTADGLSGRVVTLGQHLIDDGSPITIPEANGNGNGHDGGGRHDNGKAKQDRGKGGPGDTTTSAKGDAGS